MLKVHFVGKEKNSTLGTAAALYLSSLASPATAVKHGGNKKSATPAEKT